MNVGDKILELRKKKGYSQEDIANKLNVSRQTVSKWETNQSTPDFDKIVPLCQLFGISTDELLMDKIKGSDKKLEDKENKNSLNDVNYEIRKKFAFGLCVSIFLYFLAVMWIILGEAIGINEDINVVIFLGIASVATVIIVYVSILRNNNEEKIKENKLNKEENNIVKSINGILSLVFLIVYLVVSFVTMAWYITWIIWVVYSIVAEIVKLVFKLGESDNE